MAAFLNRLVDDPDGWAWRLWNDRGEGVILSVGEMETVMVAVGRFAAPERHGPEPQTEVRARFREQVLEGLARYQPSDGGARLAFEAGVDAVLEALGP